MPMKNFDDTIGNGTRDLPACSVVPQLTSPPRAPLELSNGSVNFIKGHNVYKCAVSLLLPHKELKLCTVVDTIMCSALHWNCLPRSVLLTIQNIKLFFCDCVMRRVLREDHSHVPAQP
jgi:hypothetical protein